MLVERKIDQVKQQKRIGNVSYVQVNLVSYMLRVIH